jgi:hypothetical protein
VSVLTKVFVLLLTISSIALSMLVVAAFSQQQNWKASAAEWQAAALSAQAKERTMAANAAIEKQRGLDMHQRDLENINTCKAELEKSKAQAAELEIAVSQAKNQLTAEQGQVTGAQDGLKLVQVALNHEKEFSAKLAKRNSELERANIDLTDRVKELTVNVEMARAQVRALQQQIAGMEPSRTATQVPGGPNIVESGVPSAAAPATAAQATAPIRGEVKEVNGGLASISVGNADGVSPGMTFLIYRRGPRGGKPMYLGSLKVTHVDANESAGNIEQSAGDIRPGDVVRDEASFALRG